MAKEFEEVKITITLRTGEGVGLKNPLDQVQTALIAFGYGSGFLSSDIHRLVGLNIERLESLHE